MRTLTSPTAAALSANHLDAAWLLEIAWPDGTTGRYADRAVQVDSTAYAAAITEWKPLTLSGDTRAPALARVEVLATPAGALWTDLRGRDAAGAVVRIGLHPLGTTAADVVWLVGGDLTRVENMSDGASRLHLRSLLAGLAGPLPPRALDTTTFPNAPVTSLGRALPLVYGNVPYVPAVCARATPVTQLRGSMSTSAASFIVESAAGPPPFPTGPITVRIDDEYLVGSFSGDTFAITTRGAAAITGALADSGTTTSLVDAARTEPDAEWVGFLLVMTGGTAANVGLERVITAFDSATQTLSISFPLPAPIVAADTYTVTTRAADHLHGVSVEQVGEHYVFLAADHPCVAVTDVRLDGALLAADDVRVDRNDTSTFPALGRAVTTITTRGRPRVKQFAEGSRFVLAQFDADGGSSPGVAWGNAIDPRPTFVAQLNATQTLLALQQTSEMGDGPARYGEMRSAFLVVHFRQDRVLADDVVDVEWNGQLLGTLDPTQTIDHAGGGGEVDLVHTHPQDLSHPVAPVVRTHGHELPGQVREVTTNADSGNAFSSTDPKFLARSSTPPHATDEIIQQTIARFTIRITSSPAGFNPFGIFRLHLKLPYGPWTIIDSVNGELTRNLTLDITVWLTQWANWPATANQFGFWVENVVASQIIVESFAGLWEVTIAPRVSDSSSTFLETETTVLPPISLDGALAPLQNAEEMLSVVYENTFDLRQLMGEDWSQLNDAVARARYVVNGTNDGAQVYIASMRIDVEYAPFTYVHDGVLTATVSGVDATGDGTGALLSNPADVIQDLLTLRLALETSRIDAAAFAQAAVDTAVGGAQLDFALTGPESPAAALHRAATEAGTLLSDGSGVVTLRVQPSVDAPPARVLTAETRADLPMAVARAGIDEVANARTLLYAQDYRPSRGADRSFGRSVVAEDAASIATYQRRPATGALRFVRDDAWAATVAGVRVDTSAWPTLECAWPAYWHHLAVERGDVVWLTDPQLGLVDAPGTVTTEQYAPGTWQARRLDHTTYGVRLAPWRVLRAFDPRTWLVWSRDGLRYVIDGVTVARVTLTGDWWIAGRYIRHAVFAAGNPDTFDAYDATTRTVYYSDASGTRLLEIDVAGNVFAAGVEEINAPLGTTVGPEGAAVSGGAVQWARGGVPPAYTVLATLTADRWRVAGRIIQNRVFPYTT